MRFIWSLILSVGVGIGMLGALKLLLYNELQINDVIIGGVAIGFGVAVGRELGKTLVMGTKR